MEKEKQEQSDFEVECNVCGMRYKNWSGSTPCCGSIAWIVENNKPTKKLSLFASIDGGPIKPTIVSVSG
jgi:predicted ATP-dependent serine protease